MNKVILTGNLCQDIDLKQTPSGKEVVTNSIAVQREYKGEETDFIQIVVWGQPAKYLSQYARKGDRVELVGRWQVRTYTDAQGRKQYVNECVVESIKAFSKPQEPQQPQFEELPQDADLPF
jgi:single-strand DNA-binding protein